MTKRRPGRHRIIEGEKMKSICVALSPSQLTRMHKIQGYYIYKYGKTLSLSRIIRKVIEKGIKQTKIKDFKK